MRDCGSAPNAYAQGFFAQEYQLDHLIHTYPKPFVCWGQGIVMGGGIGLMAGASHRVVTPNSKLAMPEISIGLYPDVGGSWVLRQMPGRVGLFLALTGVPLNAADALFCGLADFHLPGDRGLLLAVLEATRWSDAAQDNRQTLTQLLSDLALPLAVESPVQQHFGQINDLLAGDALFDMAVRLRGLDGGDVWLQAAATTFAKGSPTSAALAFAMWQQAQQLSLAEVFRLEYRVSLGCCAHPDFAEGIRALLVDKDRNPHWTPATLDAVTPDWIDAHFFVLDSPHPLASLA
jgi:enoyl-CoA hydratase/carnithine racemase